MQYSEARIESVSTPNLPLSVEPATNELATIPIQHEQVSRTRRILSALGNAAWNLHPDVLTARVENLTLKIIRARQRLEN